MVTMSELRTLNTTTELVQEILERQPDTRNSDNKLYYQVLKVLGRRKGIDIDTMSLPNYLLHMKDYGLPSIETVGRCRRKVVELHPELTGTDEVQKKRRANISNYKNYARSFK